MKLCQTIHSLKPSPLAPPALYSTQTWTLSRPSVCLQHLIISIIVPGALFVISFVTHMLFLRLFGFKVCFLPNLVPATLTSVSLIITDISMFSLFLLIAYPVIIKIQLRSSTSRSLPYTGPKHRSCNVRLIQQLPVNGLYNTILLPRSIRKITVHVSCCQTPLLYVCYSTILLATQTIKSDYEWFPGLYNPLRAGFSTSFSLELVVLAGRAKASF